MIAKLKVRPVLIGLALVLSPVLLLLLAVLLIYPTLPSLDSLTDYHPKIPLRVFSADGTLIGEFGEEHRALIQIDAVPKLMKEAILAAEDERFYEHGGVDFIGVLRAAYSNVIYGGARQGASTITMQVARNFFLTKEKTLSRKLNEALLAFKIESSMSKDEILQLYINQIYLGHRAYGFVAAAQTYYGKSLDQLNLAEIAALAGLPKAPSAYNPLDNPKRAKLRQLYVLRRMHALGNIDERQFQEASQKPITAKYHGQHFAIHADYIAEMARQFVFDRYQDESYNQGLKIFTTVRDRDQEAAYKALREDVIEYDSRHEYRGPEGFVDLPHDSASSFLDQHLLDFDDYDNLTPAIVLEASSKNVRAYFKGGQIVDISGTGLSLVKEALNNKTSPPMKIRPGSVIRVSQSANKSWRISQLPQVEAAFVSANPTNGSIYSLIGGFDFYRNQFNHVTQAWRQPGSSFKPFIYSAALEKGFTPATIINDAPLVFDVVETGGETWEPKNFDGTYDGPISMRQALTKSKNLVSIRILQAITPQYARDYAARFGFDAAKNPPYLTMALGSGSATPMKMLEGYSVFANGGFHVLPYFIQRVEDANGQVLFQAEPAAANEKAERVIDARNVYTMVNMMQDVVRRGTAASAMQLGRQDLAGKTGTTSDSMDAWFCGFHPTVVAISWVGYDTPHTLGERETGGGAALPMWIGYMGTVLQGVPQVTYTMPEGMSRVRINSQTGLRSADGDREEIFYQENIPPEQVVTPSENETKPSDSARDQLF